MSFYSKAAHPRRPHDHYPTPPDLAQALPLGLAQAGISLPRPVYDPCMGNGALLDALDGPGFGSDLHPSMHPHDARRCPTPVNARDREVLALMLFTSRSLVTNPPYGRDAQPIVETGVRLVEEGAIELAAFLVPLPWESAAGRVRLMQDARARIVPCWRSTWVPGTRGGGKMNYVWLVWTYAGLHAVNRRPTFPITVYLRKP